MKKLLFIAALITAVTVTAQETFNVEIEPLTITNAPGLHSFAYGKTSDNKWVLVGGRTDGLHQRQPFAAFGENDNNKEVFVIDPANNQVWSADLSVLPSSVYEQLQSTNQEFIQRNNTLYVFGGYGYSTSNSDHITYPYITAIDIDGIASAVIAGSAITSHFRQIMNQNMALTGGQIGYLDSTFFLCGGQKFTGRYNPMGGATYVQVYGNSIREFELIDDGTNLSMANYSQTNDPTHLHKRDYNMSPQIFPNGDHGFTMWSGVFDANDLPYLYPVDVTAAGHTAITGFNQYLSQYHSAKLPIYDADSNAMHTVFFGGMSQYTMDNTGNLVQDDNVPFVKTISMVTRFSDGSMVETNLDIEMPTLVGSGAEFIPVTDANLYLEKEILNINDVPNSRTLVGYIYGGIESSQPNIFFSNNGTQSSASSLIFKVYINKVTVGTQNIDLNGDNMYNLSVFPNPVSDLVNVAYFVPNLNNHSLTVFDVTGNEIFKMELPKSIGRHNNNLDFSAYPSGTFIIKIVGGSYSTVQKVIKN